MQTLAHGKLLADKLGDHHRIQIGVSPYDTIHIGACVGTGSYFSFSTTHPDRKPAPKVSYLFARPLPEHLAFLLTAPDVTEAIQRLEKELGVKADIRTDPNAPYARQATWIDAFRQPSLVVSGFTHFPFEPTIDALLAFEKDIDPKIRAAFERWKNYDPSKNTNH